MEMHNDPWLSECLHFAYGYTYLEIARMEGSNKSTVMRSAKTALKKIQEKLAA